MRYAITFFLLAGAVLGFGQTAKQRDDAAFERDHALVDWIELHCKSDPGSGDISCHNGAGKNGAWSDGSKTPAKTEFPGKTGTILQGPGNGSDRHYYKIVPDPAKPVAPSKQKEGDVPVDIRNDLRQISPGGSCANTYNIGRPCKAGEQPALNPFDEKQLGEWIERNCKITQGKDVCVEPEALHNSNIACLSWETRLELHCMGSKPE